MAELVPCSHGGYFGGEHVRSGSAHETRSPGLESPSWTQLGTWYINRLVDPSEKGKGIRERWQD